MDRLLLEALGIAGSASLAAITALGLCISFRLMHVINLAHGALLTIGAYVGVLLSSRTDLPWAAIVLCCALSGVAAGAVIERLLVRRVYRDPELSILATFGLAIVIVQAITIAIGNEFQLLPNPVPGAAEVLNVMYPKYRLLLMLVGSVLVVAVLLALSWTQLGLQVRAAAADDALAQMVGIRSRRVNAIVFAGSAGLAGLAGVLVAPIVGVNPRMGDELLFAAFIVVIISGGRVIGIVPGALGYAATRNLSALIWDENVARLVVLGVALGVLTWIDRPAVRSVV